MSRTLFRKEVLDQQRHNSVGEIIVLPDLKAGLIAYCVIGLVFTIFLFLIFGSYHAKQRVSGVIVPDRGIVRVYPPAGGFYHKVFVEDGQWVEEGDALALVRFESVLSSGADVSLLQENKLLEIENNLIKLIEDHPQKKALDRNNLLNTQQKLEREQVLLKNQKEITLQRLALLQERQGRLADLHSQKLISTHAYHDGRDQYLQLQQVSNQQDEQLSRIESELSAIAFQLQKSEYEANEQLSHLQSELARIGKQRAETQLTGERLLRSPISGYVTALQSLAGQAAQADKPLLTLLQEDIQFEAHLFVPSRAIGQVSPGQVVRLQYEAFPFQKFGSYQGRIRHMSRSIINPSEIQSLSLPTYHEPVYLLTIELEKQHVSAYGRQLQLQAGMLLQAEIVLDRRRLWQWLLEPLYIRGGA